MKKTWMKLVTELAMEKKIESIGYENEFSVYIGQLKDETAFLKNYDCMDFVQILETGTFILYEKYAQNTKK